MTWPADSNLFRFTVSTHNHQSGTFDSIIDAIAFIKKHQYVSNEQSIYSEFQHGKKTLYAVYGFTVSTITVNYS